MYTKDTVRLVVQFRDFSGNSIVPEDIKLVVYDSKQEILEKVTVGITDNGNGNYYYDYVAPDSDFIFEFSGIYNNKPVLSRQLIQVKFN